MFETEADVPLSDILLRHGRRVEHDCVSTLLRPFIVENLIGMLLAPLLGRSKTGGLCYFVAQKPKRNLLDFLSLASFRTLL